MTTETSPPATILIAEDSPTQAQRLRYVLEEHGYAVQAAVNGRLALEMAQETKPDLLISDVVMPEMNGYELAGAVKAHPELRETPIILVTTMSDPHDVIRGLECGADNFIIKPYEEQYLLGRVRYALFSREMRRNNDMGMGVEIYFNGQRHFITADRLQILNLLLSTYDAAMQRNKALKRSQDELQTLNAKLNEANNELESFSYSVSHDLQAPLRHIDAYAAMLASRTEGSLAPEGMRFLDVIRSECQRMRQLIGDLLTLSRTTRTEMRLRQVDLYALVQAGIRDLDTATEGRRVEWHVTPLPAAVGDPGLLRQVFANLLGNAVKYTRPRDPARIEIGASEQGEEITLFVRDNGVGFDMKAADKLFGVFQRLHHPDEFEGTGVGLANVRRIVARHGGRIWAQAAVDKGATFFVTLKRATSG